MIHRDVEKEVFCHRDPGKVSTATYLLNLSGEFLSIFNKNGKGPSKICVPDPNQVFFFPMSAYPI